MSKYIKIIPKAVRNFMKEYQYATKRSVEHVLLVDVPVIDRRQHK